MNAQLWAVFPDEAAARAALRQLPDAVVYSAEPPETLVGLHRPEPRGMGLAAVIGGAAGGLMGMGLAIYAFTRMGLHVGGFPKTPMAPVGIVFFAIAALEAITAVVIVLLVRARLATWKLPLPEDARRRVAEGAVAAQLFIDSGAQNQLAGEMRAAGAEVTIVEVK